MSVWYGKITGCSRCGIEVRQKAIEDTDLKDGYIIRKIEYDPLPEGWKWKDETGWLCPKCRKEWEELLNHFLAERKES